jgi:hypothetical protein
MKAQEINIEPRFGSLSVNPLQVLMTGRAARFHLQILAGCDDPRSPPSP